MVNLKNSGTIFFIFLSLHVSTAWCCSCIEQTVEQAYDRAVLVFQGETKQVLKTGEMSDWKEEEIIVNFEVSMLFKGEAADSVTLHTVYNKSSCDGYAFEVGKEYLVYASQQEDGTLGTRLCSRTTLLESAAEDLGILNNLSTLYSSNE